jgi:hypothetical protein
VNPVEEFRKLESGEFGFLVSAVGGSVCPGVLAIWLFNPEMISALTTPKLVILAVSFMLPYIGMNSWIVGMTTGCAPTTPKNKIYIQLFLQASVYSVFMFSTCLAIRFIWGISLNAFLIILAILEFFFFAHQKMQAAKNSQQQRPNQPEQKKETGEHPKD